MLRFALYTLAMLAWCTGAFAQSGMQMKYEVAVDTAAHYLLVKLTCTAPDVPVSGAAPSAPSLSTTPFAAPPVLATSAAPPSLTSPSSSVSSEGNAVQPFTLRMPVWAPGYYLIVDFPKYLTDFQATDADGTPLAWRKEGKNAWVIQPKSHVTEVSYRVYANERSVAESRVQEDVAFVAPCGVFMHVEGEKDSPVEVTYVLPEGWTQASSGLEHVGDWTGQRRTFVAPDFDMLYDSPVLLGRHYVKTFTHEGRDYEVALETPDGWEESGMEDDFRRVVSAASALMGGEVPYEKYCLMHLGRGPGGLEHLNSQACYSEGSFRFASREAYLNYLSFMAHEYFHLYNVKTIRPIELGPFDYDREVFTPLLWFSEGITVYYESRLLLLAGIVDAAYVLRDLSGFIRTVESQEGHRHMSLRQSSYDIWLNFFNRAANGRDTRISYYEKGPILGLLMDIDIRHKTGGQRSLDDLMRLLYHRYHLEQGRGFSEEEFWQACAEVAGEPLTLIRRYVDTTEEIDYDPILASVGLRLDRTTWTLLPLDGATEEQISLGQGMGLALPNSR